MRAERRFDVAALVVAGVVDLLAGLVAGVVLEPGSLTAGGDLDGRMAWVADNTARWQVGWAFWFVVTTTFAWAFYALARNVGGAVQWRHLAVGAALLAAAVDIVGIVLSLAVLPDLAEGNASTYSAVETLSQVLTDITAYGLYTIAGLLLLPSLFGTRTYPRALALLGAVLWGVSAAATALLAFDAPGKAGLFAVALLLYPGWVWGTAWWLAREPA